MVKKAHLVTGKGGVGKSLFAAALATHFSLQNQQILLAELCEHSFYRDFLNLPELSYMATKWKKNLDVSQWNPEDCLKEYALHLLKIRSLYNLFFENPVSRSLVRVAPGLHELALLGKLTSSPRNHGPAMSYDQIVVDSFSTGHFLSLLRAPAALHESIPLGPMGDQTQSIDTWIRNKDFMHVHIICLPEELPIQETIELYSQIKSEFDLAPSVYVNKILNLNSSELSGISSKAREHLQFQIENEKYCLEALQQAHIPYFKVDLIPSLDVKILINGLLEFMVKSHV